ncbi:hypothetical protein Bca4012_037718 [Brassica carinata]
MWAVQVWRWAGRLLGLGQWLDIRFGLVFDMSRSGLTSPGRPGNCLRRIDVIWTIDEINGQK